MNERVFTLSYQADLVVDEFIRYKSREITKRAFYLIPQLEYSTYDSDGLSILCRAVVSNHPRYKPVRDPIPSWCNFDIHDWYYREILAQHLHIGGKDSGYHTKCITYVSKTDQPLFLELLQKKLHEKYINNVKVSFKTAKSDGFIFKKNLGYEYLCVEYFD